jgi:hypothetical protein
MIFNILKKIAFYPKSLSLPFRKIIALCIHFFKLNKVIPYEIRLNYDLVTRPWYGYSIFTAAKMAKALNHKSISILEFGVAGGNGLINIEKHVDEIKKIIDIDFEVYGFDLETGLPKAESKKDLSYHWEEGFFKMKKKELEKKLKISKLVLGDVKETCFTFFEKYKPAPIGCVFIDLDYYSSTVHALKIFDGADNFFLPRLICYFDDVLGSENELYNEFSGELAAINDFNFTNKNKKISKLRCLYERKFRAGWNEMLYSYHNFEHPDYNRHISTTPQDRPLEKIYQ